MNIACVSDLRPRAKRRLPKFVFDYLDGGAGSETGVRRNERAFDELMLKPRALVNIDSRDLSTSMFGRRWAATYGYDPNGLGYLIFKCDQEATTSGDAEV